MIDFILRPIRRNFGKDKMFYCAIDDMFGFLPHNIELYKLALIHKSASIVLENGQHINNERLEFLGDAVIESVSSDYLFIEYPDKNEGFLTQLRSKMVSRQSLNSVAKRIGLDDYVITNAASGSAQKHIYGDAFEAMMGAIYLDQGYDFVNRLLINKIFTKYLKMETLAESETDFKSRLIEWCQKNHHSIHFATSHDKTYSATHPFFYSKVLIDGIEVGHGAGESKKEAEQRAAFSVSQGFNDADCTKLLDKLDNIDANSAPKKSDKPVEKQAHKEHKPKAEAKPAEEKKPKAEAKPIEDKKPVKEIVAEEEKPANEEQKKPAEESKPKPVRKPRKPAKTKENTPANEVQTAEPATTSKEEENSEQTAEPTPKAKPTRRRPIRRPRKAAEQANGNAESAPKQEAKTDKE